MRVFVIEDDRLFSKLIERTLQFDSGLEVEAFFNGKDFLNRISDNPDIITLDLGLPDCSGQEIFQQIKKYNPDTEVIVISGQDDVRTAVQMLKEGAYDYITKEESVKDRLRYCARNIINQKKLKQELSHLKTEVSRQYNYQQVVIGESSVIREVSSLVNKALKIPNINVSIYGEPGTGKELMAKIIHYNSSRRNLPFITINLAALPADSVETELFGYESGTFEGAHMVRQGKLEEASGGTIYIEEINEMDQDVQSKLLRVLQEGELMRVGGTRPVSVNIRVISASCKDLIEYVNANLFREDLYFKLKGLPIHVPLLRDRRKDIVLLANYFLRQFCMQNGLNEMGFTSGARRKLLNYSFPGNVRELKAVIELAAVLSDNGQIGEDDIVFNSSNESPDILSEELTLKEYNEKIIRYYLDKTNSVIKTAKKLGIGKSTIYNLLKSEKQGSDH